MHESAQSITADSCTVDMLRQIAIATVLVIAIIYVACKQ